MSKLKDAAKALLAEYDIQAAYKPEYQFEEWPEMKALRSALAEPEWRPASEHPSDTTEVLAWVGDPDAASPVILHYWHPDGYDNTSEWRDQDANHVKEKDILCWRDIEPPED